MSKSEKRKKAAAEKAKRKAAQYKPGGASKYALKAKRAAHGIDNPRSPIRRTDA